MQHKTSCQFVIPDDVRKALNCLQSNEKFKLKRKFSDKITKYITVVFYYWGIVQKGDLVKETVRLMDVGDDEEFMNMFDGVFLNIIPRLNIERIRSNVYYSMFANNVTEKITSLKWQNAKYPLITKDMIPENYEGWNSLILHSPYFKWIYDAVGFSGEQGSSPDQKQIETDSFQLALIVAYGALNINPEADLKQFAARVEMSDFVYQFPIIKELLMNIMKYTPNYWMKGNSNTGVTHVVNAQYKNWYAGTVFPNKVVLSSNKRSRSQKSSIEIAASRWNVGRDDLCPCGSGEKFKNCCGKGS